MEYMHTKKKTSVYKQAFPVYKKILNFFKFYNQFEYRKYLKEVSLILHNDPDFMKSIRNANDEDLKVIILS